MRDDTRYSNVVGRIRVMEKNLLDRMHIEKMLSAQSVEEAVAVLTDAGYTREGNTEEYEKLLSKELENTYAYIRKISPEPEVIELFMLKGDYHNLKIIMKSEFAGVSGKHLYSHWGTILPIKLETAINDRNFKGLPEVMTGCIKEVLDVYGRTKDPQYADIIIDSACFKHMRTYVLKLESTFLSELADIEADFLNIRMLLRIKNMNKSLDFLMRAIVKEGKISRGTLQACFESSREEMVNILKKTYSTVIEKGMESLFQTNTLTELEKLMDNYIIRFLKKYRYVAMGIEPVIGYLKAKEYEIINARIILTGRTNFINNELIRERLRETYA